MMAEKLSNDNASIHSPRTLSTIEVQNPATATDHEIASVAIKEKWNYPKHNILRLASVYLAFFNFGLNDASFGALLPEFQAYYNVSYVVVSLVFLAAFIGYGVAAFLADPLHHWIGQRGAAFVIPVCRLICYTVLICHVPWPAIVMSICVAGLGNGISEGAWNGFLVGLDSSNELLGFMHGLYGLGALVTPLIATAMVQKYNQPWWNFYFIVLGMNVLELVVGVAAFWTATGQVHRTKLSGEESGGGGRLREALSHKITWIASLFFFLYIGTEVSIGGWTSTFMLQIRGVSLFQAGASATGFWAGLTAGRMVLGFITPKIGERKAVFIYLIICIVLQLLFWLVPSFIVSAVMVALQGFFIGPIFPSTVVVVTGLLPAKLHIIAIGFSAAIGGGGAAILPFAIGAVASAKGVQTLQPIIVAFLGALLAIWLLIPRPSRGTSKTP